MGKIQYIEKRIGQDRRALMEKADEILDKEIADGFGLTLRGLHYKFVAFDLYPTDWAREVEDRDGKKVWTTNNQLAYDKLGELVNDGRLLGIIDWETMEDETRSVNTVAAWSNPGGIISTASRSYAVDMWKGQAQFCEVWVEKDARKNVIGKAAISLHVPHFSARGYPSQTSIWDAANRIIRYLKTYETVTIFYAGDHDPSGLDIPEDIGRRLALFLGPLSGRVKVERIALNMDQVRKYKPIDNFAKLSDGRAKKYVEKYGNKSWELDALDSTILYNVVRESILELRDEAAYKLCEAKLKEDKKLMQKAADNWPSVASFLGGVSGTSAFSSYPPVMLHNALIEYKSENSEEDLRGTLYELDEYIQEIRNGDRELAGPYYPEDEETDEEDSDNGDEE